MLKQAKMKTAHLSNVKIIQGDATNIPLPDGVCDAVTCTQVYDTKSFGFPILFIPVYVHFIHR